jgi:hypothetical protein
MNNDRYSDASMQPASQQRRTPRRQVETLRTQQSFPTHEADSRNDVEEDDYGDVWPPRMPTIVRRYDSNVPAGQSAAPMVYTQGNRRIYVHDGLPPGRQTSTPIPPHQRQRQSRYERDIPLKPRRRPHWMLSVGVGMLAMIALWVAGGWILQWRQCPPGRHDLWEASHLPDRRRGGAS